MYLEVKDDVIGGVAGGVNGGQRRAVDFEGLGSILFISLGHIICRQNLIRFKSSL
jgi:hypothetical protein